MGPRPPIPEPVRRVALALREAGGRAWIVGGWIRDTLIGRPTGDIDVEVGGIDDEIISAAIQSLGPAHRVGKAFPVLKITVDGMAIDIAQPRRDSRPRESGRVEPHLGINESAARRDLRINAMALDPLDGTFADPFDGRSDISTRRLRAVDSLRFLDDPLRVLRVARFAGQLNFRPDPALAELCRDADLSSIAPERMGHEMVRLLDSEHVQHGMITGCEIGLWRHIFPEVPLHVESAEIRAFGRLPDVSTYLASSTRTVAVGLGVLLHRTKEEHREGILDRWNIHRREGLNLRRIIANGIENARLLGQDCEPSALRSIAESSELGVALSIAHCLEPSDRLEEAMNYATRTGIKYSPLLPLIHGRDLITLGVPKGETMGVLLDQIRAAQLNGRISTPEAALEMAAQLIASEL